MLVSFKAPLIFVCVAALVLVAWRLILPLGLLCMGGLGVDLPLPKRLAMSCPRLAISVFVLGGPLLFIVLVAAIISLLRI
jgi:hypothetical protein